MAKYYYELSDKEFVNPYHFVPLEDKCKKGIDYREYRKKKDLKTGWIECELKTLTPIFIPNTVNDDFFKERQRDKDDNEITINSYDFFSYRDNGKETEPTDTAIIPGSSIRGTIRSAFETLTNSCMSTTDDDNVLYKRVTSPAKPGRLVKDKENDQWKIVECEKYMLKTKDCRADPESKFDIENYEDKQEVYIKSGTKYRGKPYMPKVVSALSKTKTSECTTKGYLHKGEPFGSRKHHESVFVEQNSSSFNVSKQDVENLLENYRLFQDETLNLHKKKNEHDGYVSNIKNADNVKNDSLDEALIYYAKHNGKYYLSPAAIGREVFHNRLTKLINTYSPCTSHDNLCPACALFGFAGKKSENDKDNTKNAIASRVRFSDAKTEKPEFLAPVILPELAGPKTSSTEFYMKKPSGNNVTMWNYDYAECKGKKELQNYNNYNPQIQGRKFYWHHADMQKFDDENKNRFNYQRKNSRGNMEDAKIPYSDRLVKIRPVNKDVTFTFKVHFNQLTKDELDKLLWTLSLGGNNDLAHKIGMGKPVGLGSVQIRINKVIERKLSIKNGSLLYDENTYSDDYKHTTLCCSSVTKQVFEKIADFKNKPNNIHYPYCIDDKDRVIPESYDWFVGNKQINGVGTGTNHVISENLKPVKSEKYPLLRVIKKFEGNAPRKSYPDSSKPAKKPKKKKKSEVDKLIEKIEKAKLKEVKKILSKLKDLSLSENDIQKIGQKIKKRPDSKQSTNPMVQKYFEIYKSMTSM